MHIGNGFVVQTVCTKFREGHKSTQSEPESAKQEWGIEQTEVFEKLKRILTKAPVLGCPDFTRQFSCNRQFFSHATRKTSVQSRTLVALSPILKKILDNGAGILSNPLRYQEDETVCRGLQIYRENRSLLIKVASFVKKSLLSSSTMGMGTPAVRLRNRVQEGEFKCRSLKTVPSSSTRN